MDFDVVLATRNRASAVALSLPLLCSQSRAPRQIIVVDSSDDPAPVAAIVASLSERPGVPIRLLRSEKGSTRQRNAGLAHVTAPVVFLPDDDSLCHPGTTEALMRIYERDDAGLIAGVRALDAREPPPGVDLGAAYRVSSGHRRTRRLKRFRRRVGRWLPDRNPFLAMAGALSDRVPAPDWLAEENAVRTGWMTGYLMSFRTPVLRTFGFEEAFAGYGLFEDVDASFQALGHGALVAAQDARIYHHRAPTGRPDPYAFAALSIVNRGFIFAKQFHTGRLSEAQCRDIRRRTYDYARLRLAGLMPRLYRADARRAFRGTRDGIAALPLLFSASPGALPAVYREIAARLGLG